MIPKSHDNIFRRFLLLIVFCFTVVFAHAQQDLELSTDATFLQGKNVIKVKRDFADPYLWALTDNNEVYRINSVSKTVDNYTEKFKAYNHLKFIDIAGISKDTVFVATNTDKLLELKVDQIKVISQAEGMRGTINSIGHDYRNHEAISEVRGFSIYLLIATDHGFCRYNFIKDEMGDYSGSYDFASKVFESSNRNLMTNDNFEHYLTEGADNYAVMLFTQTTGIWANRVFLNNTIGRTVRTAYYIGGNLDYRYNSGRVNQYWATEKGLFINNANGTRNANSNIMSYLPGIRINKLTSILGLTAFKNTMFNPGLHRENILIAADNGLYFSNSAFKEFAREGISKHSFYRYAPLNGKKVNDISVNSVTYYDANYSYYYGRYCEDKVWVAAVDGLYLIRPDYSKFLNTQTLSDLVFKDKPNVKEITLCGNVTEKAVIDGYNEMIYEWYRNDIKIEGENKNELDIKTGGIYKAILYDPCSGVHVKTNTLKVTQTAGPTFTFNYPDKINICDKQPATLTAAGSAAYSYRWYKDGVLTGNVTNKLSATTSGKYKVEVSACPDSWVASKEVQVNFINLPVTTLMADKAVYCSGEQAKLTINIPVSPKYTIYWLRDGVVADEYTNEKEAKTTVAGTYSINVKSTDDASCMQPSQPIQVQFISAPVFAFNYQDVERTCAGKPFELKVDGNTAYNYRWFKNNVQLTQTTYVLSVTQSGDYRAEVSACSGTWVPSKTVKVNVISIPAVKLSADKAAYCVGDNATLFINIPTSADYIIRWWRDGDPLIDAINQTSILTDRAGQYNVTVEAPGLAGCTQISQIMGLTFSPMPTLSINQVVNTTLCEGSTIDLKAIYPSGTGGGIRWSTGQTGDVLKVTRSGTYTAELNTPAGCVVKADITVNLPPNPVLDLADVQLCPYDNESVTLVAPAGYVKYVWNNQQGTTSYTVNRLGSVSLTVTDVNGCTATQSIKVTNKCDDIKIPNAFTPNGDGINDTWNISGIEGDGAVTVKIYNRNGILLYENVGYTRAWDGTYRGQQLPPGTYYYVIKTKNSSQVLSGAVAILR